MCIKNTFIGMKKWHIPAFTQIAHSKKERKKGNISDIGHVLLSVSTNYEKGNRNKWMGGSILVIVKR